MKESSLQAATPLSLRAIARKVGIGSTLLKLRHQAMLGPLRAIRLWRARQALPRQVMGVDAAAEGRATIQVHMLLGRARIFEGLWALLSLSHLSLTTIEAVIYDDGSLSVDDVRALEAKLPQLRIIEREEADVVVLGHLERRNLRNCLEFRRRFVLARKLFDPVLFATRESYVVLDSDVLFFQSPTELVSGTDDLEQRAVPLYSVDNGYRYSFDEPALRLLGGIAPIDRLNSGIMRLNRSDLSFGRIDRYLLDRRFWNADGSADYYAEMTMFALELAHASASPLPDSYAIAPDPAGVPEPVAGHYCGGIGSAFTYYTSALPRVRKKLPLGLAETTHEKRTVGAS